MKNQNHPNIKIDKIPKEGMFKVPDGYFENLSDRILTKVKTLPIEASKVRIIPYSRRRLLRIAATIAGFIILSFAGYQIFQKTQKNDLLSQADAYDVADYYVSEFDERTLMISALESEQEAKMESEAMINFLVDEGIEEETLLQAL